MLPHAVKRHVDALRKALATRGWKLVELEHPFEDEWWAAGIWIVESEWAPQGTCVYVTFLTDPMGSGKIWAVCASRSRPTRQTRGKAGAILSLGHGWQAQLPVFIKQLDQLRAL